MENGTRKYQNRLFILVRLVVYSKSSIERFIIHLVFILDCVGQAVWVRFSSDFLANFSLLDFCYLGGTEMMMESLW